MLHLELIWMESHQVRYILILQVNFFVGDLSKGHRVHSRSRTVFLPITWDPNEIETWDWCHCACLRKAHRMMYNLTYLGHLALTWPEVKFWPWPFKVELYMVRRALTRQTRYSHNRCSIFYYLLKQRRYRRKTILVNFDLLTSGDLNFDLSLKWPK